MSVTLGDIIHNHVALMCRCGHSSMHSVADLLEVFPKETSYGYIKANARCTMCKQKGQAEARIIYLGGSHLALRGGDQKKP